MTRTPLFDIMQGVQSEMEIETAYRGFVDEVFSLLASSVDSRNLLVMLQFTELELQCRRNALPTLPVWNIAKRCRISSDG